MSSVAAFAHHASLQLGDELPALVLPPLTRHALALYCGASGDHNPIHVDIDFARNEAGLPDVIAHGMLSMAWLGRFLTQWAPQGALREFNVRFAATTAVGESITCTGRITERFERQGETCVRVAVQSANAQGQVKLAGDAVIVLPQSG